MISLLDMIFAQSSSREALRGEILRRKSENPRYSMNAFAKRSGISVGYLSLLLSGKRNLSCGLAEQLANSARFTPIEKEYFLLLVRRERAEDEVTRRHLDLQITSLRERIGADAVNLKAFEVMADWYYSALLEYLTLPHRSHDPKEMALRLGVTTGKVKKALATLVELGLAKKVGYRFERIDAGILRTSTEIRSQALRKFHKQILKMGAGALDAQPVEKRSCTGATMAVDPSRIPEAKKMILNFQRDLMAFLQRGNPTGIYQLQIQLFDLLEPTEAK